MSLTGITQIIDGSQDNFKTNNFYYDSSNLNIINGNYNPPQSDEPTDTETMSSSIHNKCTNLLDADEQLTGLINENDPDYALYKESDLYKKSPENVKNLNAFIWYYSTNRLKYDSQVQMNNYDKYYKFKESNPYLDSQLKNLGCQVLSDKAVYANLDGATPPTNLLLSSSTPSTSGGSGDNDKNKYNNEYKYK